MHEKMVSAVSQPESINGPALIDQDVNKPGASQRDADPGGARFVPGHLRCVYIGPVSGSVTPNKSAVGKVGPGTNC